MPRDKPYLTHSPIPCIPPINLQMSIVVETSKKHGIRNFQDYEITEVNRQFHNKILRTHPNAILRTEPSASYNCHGMSFASKRTWVIDSYDIQRILEDDSYKEITDPSKILAGDLVIYYGTDGDPNHSGLVIETSSDRLFTPMILSKWGNSSEFIHALNDVPTLYGPVKRFYRCTR